MYKASGVFWSHQGGFEIIGGMQTGASLILLLGTPSSRRWAKLEMAAARDIQWTREKAGRDLETETHEGPKKKVDSGSEG